MTLLAAFKLLLFRYSHQSDVLVGSPIAGRNFAEIEPLIGFFVNTLVLRTDLSGQPSFRRLLQRVRHTALAAYTHQDLPFEKLVEALQPERSLSHAPLFQVMFAWQTVAQPAAVSLPDLRLAPVATENRTAKFDLSLSLAQEGDYLGGVLEYNRDLFTEGTIQRMLDHFYLLLAGVLAQPDRPITQIPLLTPTERQQLLVAWNDTNASFPERPQFMS
jgi:non-ribosomal peptide synthetase component F